MRPTSVVAAVVFVLSLAVYVATCARTVTLVDSGELIVAAATLGVAHPPGFPVYTLVGHLFSLLPFGSVAFRLSFMSAFFGAVAAALVALIVYEIERQPAVVARSRRSGGRKEKGKRKGEAPPAAAEIAPVSGWLAALPPAAAGLAFAWGAIAWSYAVVAEVYTLNLALLGGVLLLLLVFRRHVLLEEGNPRWLLPLAGLLYGLALGVHHVTVVLAFPAFAFLLLQKPVRRRLRAKTVAWTLAAGALGLGFYLYLPWAASREPLLNWGDPDSWQRFFWHVSARQFQTNLFSGNAEQFFNHLGSFFKSLGAELTLAGVALGLLGAMRLWRRLRWGSLFLLLLAVFGIGYAVNYDIAEDTGAYYLVTFLVLAVAAGAGLFQIAEWAARRRGWAVAAVALAALLPAANLVLHFTANDLRRDLVARHYVEDALAGVPTRGQLLTLDWQLYSPFLYLHHLEGFRPDVTVVDVNLVRRSWYVETYLRRVYPQLLASTRQPADAYLAQLRRWEQGEPHDPNVITARFTEFLNTLIAFHPGAVHITPPMEPGVGEGYRWMPRGLTFELSHADSPMPALLPLPPLHLEGLQTGPGSRNEVVATKVRPAYAEMLGNRGRFLAASGQLEEAKEPLATALALDPDNAQLRLLSGDIAMAEGRREDARKAYERAARLAPDDPQIAARLRASPP